MAKVFTTWKSYVVRLGHYGEATNDVPVIVPQSVADELKGHEAFRIEPDDAPKSEEKSPRPRARADKEEE